MSTCFDAIVIGSGFGGAVSACRLAEAGQRVLVLERGRRWTTEELPRGPDDDWVFDAQAPQRHHGWLDLRLFPRVGVAQGAGVGGGSLIYANVFVEAERFVFDHGWPEEIDFEALAPHYATTGRMLEVQTLPEGQRTARHRLMREAAGATGAADRFRDLPLAVRFDEAWHYGLEDPHDPRHSREETNVAGLAQGTCVHCGECDLGCPVGARNTLDLNYLARAEDHGTEIRPLCLVYAIEPEGDGYRVRYRRLDGGDEGSESAHRVVVAAGSLGSTELLLRCRDQYRTLPAVSPRLGHGWCANGDFLTPALYAGRDVSPTRGPTITCAIDYLDGSDGGARYFVEDGGFPDVVGNALRAALERHAAGERLFEGWRLLLDGLLSGRDPHAHLMPWFGQGVDASDGVMRLERGWFDRDLALELDYDVRRSRPVVQALIERHKRLSSVTGGLALEPPSWSLFDYLLTPHPLGGCNMGTSAEDGVVDHKGEVFGYPGLHVLDGAIVPRALGLNPSRTIAALAERAMAEILA
ncbi:GMC oxidoreductase [Halomonas sp. I1]|uniref:GMC oxidoreductase n=1 Tax=Halomonas sp. I1 TaxID=393536 RepID=UPI0028DEDB43|nr:GMC oxidoreductase [Halomonas sp. I1]MDT8894724.1 GMC oxidoreductase [Halomonas sp. I1]